MKTPHVSELHAVIVGGGVAGLVAAREIAKIGLHVTVIEAADAAGGAVARVQLAGLDIDSGAESYATRGGHVAALVHELGLDGQVVAPNPAGAWLRLPDGAGRDLSIPMPRGGVLGIPSNPLADDVRRALGWGGAWRAYLDRVMPVLTIGRAHNLGKLVEKRLGKKVLDRLVAPVAGGVYSASPYDLDVDLAAPGLNRALTRAGSLTGGVALLRGDAKPGSAVSGLHGGMYTLVEALVASIESFGGVVRTGMRVAALQAPGTSPASSSSTGASSSATASATSSASGTSSSTSAVASASPETSSVGPAGAGSDRPRWRITLHPTAPVDADAATPRSADGTPTPAEVIDSDFVVIATSEAPARTLLTGLDRCSNATAGATVDTDLEHALDADLEQALAAVPRGPAPIELVTLVLDAPELDAQPRGTGILVAPGSSVRAKAMTHSSAKWSWLAERLAAETPHRHVIRLSYGRQGDADSTAEMDDAALVAQALADASTLFGVALDGAHVVASARTPWRGTVPVATIGHREAAERVRETVQAIAGLEVTGAWLSGTGLASVIPHAQAAASRIRHAVIAQNPMP